MLKCLFNRILEYKNKNKNYNAYKKCNWPPIRRKPSLTELNKNWIVLKDSNSRMSKHQKNVT